MPYPLSSEVVSGQPTAALHYNNLRKDALYLGMDVLNSAGMAALLARFEDGLRIELLGTDRIRVPASAGAMVYLVVNGYMLTAAANVDLALGAKPAGVAAQYYVFAVRSETLLNFTLDVNTTITESTDRRRIGGFYWNGTLIEAASIYMEKREYMLGNLGMVSKQTFGGRLTLASGVPVGDVSSSGTVYYTPYLSNRVSVYGNGMGWREYPFAELSKSLSGMPADKPADVFLCNISGTLTLELVAWASATARSAALILQDGVKVKNGDPTRVYLGTVGMTGTAAVSADTEYKRLVWNMYNRVLRELNAPIGYNSWTYTTTAWRAAYGSAAGALQVCTGLGYEAIQVIGVLLMESTGGLVSGPGIGVDATNVNSAAIRAGHQHTGIGPGVTMYKGKILEGLRTYNLLEWGAANLTFYGSVNGSDSQRSGIEATVMM